MTKENPQKDKLWAEAKRRCRLNNEDIRVAKEMRLNPRSLIKNIPSKSKPWKSLDGSKALRKGIDEVFGPKGDVRSAMKAAFSLEADRGIAKLKKLAQWLEHEYSSAASSLLEGLEEMFTINRLDLPGALRRCLGTTNVIESPYSGVRFRTRRVKNWRDASMVLRWVASSLLSAEKHFRRVMGYQQLWILASKLQEVDQNESVALESRVA